MDIPIESIVESLDLTRPLSSIVLEATSALPLISTYAIWRSLTALGAYKAQADLGNIRAELEVLNALTPDDQVRHSLVLEYGYLLPELQDVCFIITPQTLSGVVILNPDHAHQSHPDFNPTLPAALVRGHNPFYVLDGHHRIGEASRLGCDTVLLLKVI